MSAAGPLVLRSDVVLVPVTDLSAEVRAKFESDEGDYTVSRLHGRMPSQIIDGETAALLKIFRQPTTIVDAVIRNSRELSKDPGRWLEELLPHLDGFIRNRVLVPVGSEEDQELRPLLASGARAGEWEAVRCVHLMEDSEIHLVRRGDVEGAMKIARTAASFDNEAEVLHWLDGRGAPRLLDSGTHDAHPYIVTEWCEGSDATVASSLGKHDRASMLALCTAIADAYAALHELHVVHSDVHPRNVMVGSDRTVRLIDFGLSRIDGHSTHRTPRGGMYTFFEPEYLAAVREGQQLASSFAGEQYAVGALLYLLITGKHYLDFRLEREEMMRQAECEPPVTFAARGIPPWPEVEAVLVRALEKDPAKRFASMRALANALRAAQSDADEELPRAFVDEEIAALAYDIAPKASINYGAAGAAFGLLRIATIRSDPKLLARADVWRSRAALHLGSDDGWYDDGTDLPKALIGPISPYHTAAGLHATAAFLAYARGDRVSRRNAIQSFIEASQAPCDNLDLTLGRCGTLLAAALLFEIDDGLRELGDAIARDVWQQLDARPPLREQPRDTYLGIAHGWSGYLYAMLRWSLATRSAVPETLIARLHELAALRVPRGRGAYWPRQLGGGLHDMMPGWCNGAAGHVFLWTTAADALRDPSWLELAEQAAWNAWEEPLRIADLCCGSAGRAYALLNFYRHTGQREWLGRARQLAIHAAGAARETAQRPHALWKGELGIAVLLADLESPEQAAMPLFE